MVIYLYQYFDVDTVDVQQRITRTFLPLKKNPAFYETISSTPDAYGPFWLSITLVFSLASSSNVASYLDFDGDTATWSYDFSRLATASTLVEVLLLGVPFILWAFGKYSSIPLPLSFLFCLYGYSAVIFIPGSVGL